MDVFLSASVPSPTRSRQYFDSADPLLIREAVKALVEVVIPRGRLVFGGHPAITPLIAFFIQQFGLDASRLTVYQSDSFRAQFPAALRDFYDVRIVTDFGSRESSLDAMRKAMLSSTKFHAGVFIGGMEGVVGEAHLFREMHPNALFLPVASAGGAAARLYERESSLPKELISELTYRTLFRRLLRRPF